MSLVLNSNFTISLAIASATFRFLITYNMIYKGRVGHDTLFFLCSVADNPVARWYDASSMLIFLVAYLGNTCRGFSPLNTLMKVPPREAYQSTMSTIAPIDS